MGKSSKYLYDVEATQFKSLVYEIAIATKFSLATQLHNKLTDKIENFYRLGGEYDDAQEIRERLFYVEKALKHNKMLLEEMLS